uniref:MICOS complex subunit n=1 Tax=Piliocolobus tephrosceles TaxID=591936 RepID=A0A8C9HRD4_9PRIM
MAAIGKLTIMPAGLIYASVSVHAAKEEESKKQLEIPEQVPIYTAPPLQSKYVEEQPGHLQMGFASICTATGHYTGWCKGVFVFVKNGIIDTVQFGKDAHVYLKNPPQDFLPKMGVIVVSGLVATVCYPVLSVIIAKVTGEKVYATNQHIFGAVKSLWTKAAKTSYFLNLKKKTKLGSSAEIEVPAKTTHVLKHAVPLPTELNLVAKTKSESNSGATQFMPDPKFMDHGWSHPEDIDKYSTGS